MSHLVWELATYHFEHWLNIANIYAKKKIRPKPNFDFEYDYNSIVIFPKRSNKLEKHSFNALTWGELECPYILNKKRDLEEISHLPMRLAITNGNEEDKKAAEKYLRNLRVLSAIR
ncbi:hypothetical protein [Paenibacillus crassostreae]|uniref:Uncharacterized protein n=1 Tax=Paenibacillus crassostreae TaxID=1763538 RepID=A0A167DWX1_9BACL|nr:hypothetical protein [Paenibacillus crassostreae]AOZ90963.1 hypothetical protein LPB68_01265 [Paenibacillus crassostreae]OAB74874.1 hypothetical protein PNBC_12690 [Paenibacillus crassostreae]